MVKLLLDCNPNTIELLGLDEDQYLIKNTLGQELWLWHRISGNRILQPPELGAGISAKGFYRPL